jgi:hypothetical protein
MSDDEVEEIDQSMTVNDELHLFGMRRDDEEDLLGDAEALLGRSCSRGDPGPDARSRQGRYFCWHGRCYRHRWQLHQAFF